METMTQKLGGIGVCCTVKSCLFWEAFGGAGWPCLWGNSSDNCDTQSAAVLEAGVWSILGSWKRFHCCYTGSTPVVEPAARTEKLVRLWGGGKAGRQGGKTDSRTTDRQDIHHPHRAGEGSSGMTALGR